MKEIYEKVIAEYGRIAQHEKAIEEMKELTTEIWNYMQFSRDNRQERLTERADVQNLLNQLDIMWGFTQEEIEAEMRRKMERTLERINHTK